MLESKNKIPDQPPIENEDDEKLQTIGVPRHPEDASHVTAEDATRTNGKWHSKAMLAREAEVEKRFAALPPLDSPEFWRAIEENADGRVVEPELMIRSARALYLQGHRSGVERLFIQLFDRYDPQIQKWASANKWVRGNPDYIDDVSGSLWERLHLIAIGRIDKVDWYVRFACAFDEALFVMTQNIARTVVRQAGGGVPIPVKKAANTDVAQDTGEGVAAVHQEQHLTPHTDDERASTEQGKANKKMSLRQNQQSLYDPATSSGKRGERVDGRRIIDMLEDFKSQEGYSWIEILSLLKQYLDEFEESMILLLMDGASRSEVARVLNVDRETITRRIGKVRVKMSFLRPNWNKRLSS